MYQSYWTSFLKPRTCKKLSGDTRTITDELSSVSFTNFKCSMHPTGPMLAFQLNIPEIFSEALVSSTYMVAMPMYTILIHLEAYLFINCASSTVLTSWFYESLLLFSLCSIPGSTATKVMICSMHTMASVRDLMTVFVLFILFFT